MDASSSIEKASGQEHNRISSVEMLGRSHWSTVLLANTCFGKSRLCQAIWISLPIPVIMMFPPNSLLFCLYNHGFDDKPGSNLMSFNHHMLTARDHMDLATWLMTQVAQ